MAFAEHMVSYRIIGNMVAKGLAYPPEAFTSHRHYGYFEFLLYSFCNRFDIVSDKTDRAFGEYADTLCKRKKLFQLMERGIESFISPIHNILFLEVRGDMHSAEGIDSGLPVIVVSPAPPAVLSASDGAVADGDLVFYRAPDHAFCSCKSTSSYRHDARPRFYVGLDLAGTALTGGIIGSQMLGPVLSRFFRIGIQNFLYHFLCIFNRRAHSSSFSIQC